MDFYEDPQEMVQRKPRMRIFCPICGKPPIDKTVCPNCGLENICGYHLYRFFSDRENSPVGCSKCGPRCAMCGAQTLLQNTGERALCQGCIDIVNRAEVLKKKMRQESTWKLAQSLTSLLTLVGLGAGIYLGFQPDFQKMIQGLIKTPLPPWLLTFLWGFIGLVGGSFVSGIVKTLLGGGRE